ncbi:MAG: hypothetical protein Kow0074_19130 [Candidatus Zixiibacteriota bacterium]
MRFRQVRSANALQGTRIARWATAEEKRIDRQIEIDRIKGIVTIMDQLYR